MMQEIIPFNLRMISATLILYTAFSFASLLCVHVMIVMNSRFLSILQVDGSTVSKQGLRFVFTDGSRIIFRLSVQASHLLYLKRELICTGCCAKLIGEFCFYRELDPLEQR